MTGNTWIAPPMVYPVTIPISHSTMSSKLNDQNIWEFSLESSRPSRVVSQDQAPDMPGVSPWESASDPQRTQAQV